MSKDAIKRIAALGAVAALAAAPAAFADQPADPGNGHGQSGEHGNSGNAPGHNKDGEINGQAGENGNSGQAVVMYVFKGEYAGDSKVDVTKGNKHVRKANLVDTTVSFDLSESSIVAKDTNDDGEITLADVKAGDKVVVKSRLPRQLADPQPFDAAQLIDQSRKPAEVPEVPEAPETPETPAP
jgi:hypothetical protein